MAFTTILYNFLILLKCERLHGHFYVIAFDLSLIGMLTGLITVKKFTKVILISISIAFSTIDSLFRIAMVGQNMNFTMTGLATFCMYCVLIFTGFCICFWNIFLDKKPQSVNYVQEFLVTEEKGKTEPSSDLEGPDYELEFSE